MNWVKRVRRLRLVEAGAHTLVVKLVTVEENELFAVAWG